MPKAPWLPTTTACWRGSALWPTPPTALDPRERPSISTRGRRGRSPDYGCPLQERLQPLPREPGRSRGVALASDHVDAVASVGLGAVHGRVRAPHPVVGVDQQAVRLGQSDAQRAVLGGGGFAALFQETRADADRKRTRLNS